jgi:hypothetical protein
VPLPSERHRDRPIEGHGRSRRDPPSGTLGGSST